MSTSGERGFEHTFICMVHDYHIDVHLLYCSFFAYPVQ